MLIGNARMYSVAQGATAAWRALLARVAADADVALDILDYPYPASLQALWERPDLGCVFMCGWPYAKEAHLAAAPPRPVLAAPVPLAAWSAGQPVYRAEFLVRADASAARLEDMFGTRYAFTARNSHSGYNAPRRMLAEHAARAPLFAAVVGPVGTPRRAVEAVLDGAADITAGDSYVFDLLRRHEPAMMAGTRILAATPPSPIPPFVGAPGLKAPEAERLRAALLALEHDAAGRALLHDVCAARFVTMAPAVYDATLPWEHEAVARGYPDIA